MYGGVGVRTARGTGTNGYVQKNLSYIPPNRKSITNKADASKTQADLAASGDLNAKAALLVKKPNEDIIKHEKKRQVEVQLLLLREEMEKEGYFQF